MPTIYVSNPSRQNIVFAYRTEKVPAGGQTGGGPIYKTIPSGMQIEIRDLSPEQLGYVVEQIERMGGENAAVAHGRMTQFTGLLWRERAPVTKDEILVGNQSVEAAGERRSVEQVTRSAAAFDRTANSNRGRTKQRIAKVTEVEIIQELPPHAHKTGNEIEFHMTVDPTAQADARVPGL